MIVTFISECEKKSLKKTRRVLDSFASRIGNRTWQTAITNQGVNAVRKLLRKTASKNTAVSCHWIRQRTQTELLWIVGNRQKFNNQGIVPVSRTKKNIVNTRWENDWHYLPLIKALSALAALFHDWGKASELFQEKLDPKNKKQYKGDPLRHEWISTVFLNAYVGGESDEQWLARLAKGEFDIEQLKALANQSAQASLKKRNVPKPLYKLPQAASLVAWLILTHHRLPLFSGQYKSPAPCSFKGKPAKTFQHLFKEIRQTWGYENNINAVEFKKELPRCFSYPNGFPSDSKRWIKAVKKQATRLLTHLELLNIAVENGTVRIILNHSRLALMLGDHYYSSLDPDDKDRLPYQELNLYANTDKEGNVKQTLDEHLLGVARQAQKTAQFLPMFEGKHLDELTRDSWYVRDTAALRKKSPEGFEWQDKAVIAIKKWRKTTEKLDSHHFGFFAVNLASTGKGKTFANAKIMRSLSSDEKSLRYILALGLRTLTLQTGIEYRTRVGLKDDELAILIGSKAVLDLHNQTQKEQQENNEFLNGSESKAPLLDNEIFFDSPIPASHLKTLLRREKDHKFLYAPVLSCTIDHLMSATETKRGGRYILPTLRLMSSDLVIDEIDDFEGEDLIAIGRLIHLAGMLGRKVMISSATIPPDLAEGYFNAYQSGWSLFASMRNKSPLVGCAWIDENRTHVKSINCQQTEAILGAYQRLHSDFICKRIVYLNTIAVKRKAEIIRCDVRDIENESDKQQYYFQTIQHTVIKQHKAHSQMDHQTGKHVSFGAVRLANITPCVELTEYLLNAQWAGNIDVRIMTYHSRQVLLMRHEQEKHLDHVLKRDKDDDQAIFNKPLIRQHLDKIIKPQVIFIAVVSPVEEVGRDHDWDWAVIEPSSYRSFIQMAGRVLRHRNKTPDQPNIALLQYNLKGLLGKKIAFHWPGYESKDLPLKTHNLKTLIDEKRLQKRLDSTPRIAKKKKLAPDLSLADLEHVSIQRHLTRYQQHGAESLQGWLNSYWWLTAEPQQCVWFRRSHPMLTMYLVPSEKGDGDALYEKDKRGHLFKEPSDSLRRIIRHEILTKRARERLWLYRDYNVLLRALDEDANVKYLAAIYGELSIPIDEKNEGNTTFTYSNQLGLAKRKPPE